MTKSLLNIKLFEHVLFTEFTTVFEEMLRIDFSTLSGSTLAHAKPNSELIPIDLLIKTIMLRDPRIVDRCLRSAANKVLPGDLPFDPLGDAIVAFYLFVMVHKRLPRLCHSVNDVMYHLKISGELSDPLRVFLTDKEYVKIYVAGIIGIDFNVRSYSVLRNDIEINNFDFSPKTVIKPTNNCGLKLFCNFRKIVDKEKIKSWFNIDYYTGSREINYKPLLPKVIVEEWLVNFYEVKVFMLFGRPKFLQVVIQRGDLKTVDHFTASFERLPITLVQLPG